MATIKPGTYETTVIDGTRYVALRTWARDIVGLSKSDERHVCTLARKTDDDGVSLGLIPGARQTFGGLWIIPVDTPVTVIPERTGGAVVRRPDGRIRFVVYMTDVEYAGAVKRGMHVVDLRVARKTRRDAKRAKLDTPDVPDVDTVDDDDDATGDG